MNDNDKLIRAVTFCWETWFLTFMWMLRATHRNIIQAQHNGHHHNPKTVRSSSRNSKEPKALTQPPNSPNPNPIKPDPQGADPATQRTQRILVCAPEVRAALAARSTETPNMRQVVLMYKIWAYSDHFWAHISVLRYYNSSFAWFSFPGPVFERFTTARVQIRQITKKAERVPFKSDIR